LLEHFPREREALDKYLTLLGEVQRAASRVFAPKSLPKPLALALMPARSRALSRYFEPTTAEVLEELTDDVELRAVLTGQWGDYGLPPKQSSFGIHALVAGHYLSGGGFYPVGGASTIAAGAKQVIESAGGAVLVRAEVDRILVERGKAVGVRLADGLEIRTGTVVSAAGLATTLQKLLAPEEGEHLAARRTLKAAGTSLSHACLYVGLDGEAAPLGLTTTNLWLYPGPDHDLNVARYLEDDSAEDPVAYISFPSAKDPTWTARFPGKGTVEVIGLAPYARFAEWRDQPWRKRGNAYNAYKAEMAERYLAALLRHRPQLEGRIAYYEISTPLSTEHFTNHPGGSIYGLAHGPARFMNDHVRPQTEIPGLYLTGQDVVTAGVAGALMSGAMTATSILGLRGLRDLRDWAG
jgi:phytoene dehydrogenase-like protein